MTRAFACVLSILLFPTCLAIANASAQQTTRGFQPLVMLTEYNPWAMVVGSDSPTFVLYDNGIVIYLKQREYVSAKLSPPEVAEFVSRLGPDALIKLKDSYSITASTDQPTNVLLLKTDGKYKKLSVYGNIRYALSKTEAPPLPIELSNAFRQLLNYGNVNSSAWMPEYIEVMIWPFEYAKGKAVEWPKEWPGITDSKTIKRKGLYSLFIPASRKEELMSFIAQLKPTQAVVIDQKKWAISSRLPFPHELQ